MKDAIVETVTTFIVVFSITLGLIYAGVQLLGNSKTTSTTKSSQSTKIDIKPVELTDSWRWTNDHSMFLSLHDVHIKNNTSSDIKDVEIVCSASGESGTSIDRNSRTQYKVIKAGQTLDLGKVDMGFLHSQAYKVGCIVKNYSKA
jgi:hypothetical protein